GRILPEKWQGYGRVKKNPRPGAADRGSAGEPSGPTVFHGRFTMKKPYPWFRSGRGWYVEIDAKQYFLGPHPDHAPPPQKSKKPRLWNPPPAILDAFYDRRRQLRERPAEDGNPMATPTAESVWQERGSGPVIFPSFLPSGPCQPYQSLTVEKLCRLFLPHAEKHTHHDTAEWYRK